MSSRDFSLRPLAAVLRRARECRPFFWLEGEADIRSLGRNPFASAGRVRVRSIRYQQPKGAIPAGLDYLDRPGGWDESGNSGLELTGWRFRTRSDSPSSRSGSVATGYRRSSRGSARLAFLQSARAVWQPFRQQQCEGCNSICLSAANEREPTPRFPGSVEATNARIARREEIGGWTNT